MRWILLTLLICLSSCGYQMGQGGLAQYYNTISVPYVVGDLDGSLTAAIVRKLGEVGSFEYRRSGGALCLEVKLIDYEDENIGFSYELNKHGERIKSIIPVETRTTGLIEIVLYDAGSGCILLGPTRLSGYVDYDHDYYMSRNGVNVFSLGQLTDIDAARDAAQIPLNDVLAQRVVDFINDSW